jgi:DNA modification methylase
MSTESIKNLSSYYRYSTVPTEVMNSNKLSAASKGLLAFLLSLPENHNIKKADLPNYFKEGYFALNNAFEELVDNRLIHKIELRDKKGHFRGYDYVVHEFPKKRSSEAQKVIPHVTKRKPGNHKNSDLINRVFNEDCLVTMKKMPDEFVDMIITSPPYDEHFRKYKGNNKFDFEKIAVELTRILKQGGILAWIVGDSVVRGGESGSCFRQALFFKQNCGLRLYDTLIFEKNSSTYPAKPNGIRYTQIFDYIFLLSKGKPKTVNLIADRKNKYFGVPNWGRKTYRDKDDNLVAKKKMTSKNEYSPRTNIWRYVTSGGEKIAHQHPAIMPDALAGDLIISFSNENDLVYDCFSGSGTTLKAAKSLNRRYIGSEIVKEYCDLIQERLKNC